MESGEVGGKKHEIKSISLRVESGKNLNERIDCEDKMKKGRIGYKETQEVKQRMKLL